MRSSFPCASACSPLLVCHTCIWLLLSRKFKPNEFIIWFLSTDCPVTAVPLCSPSISLVAPSSISSTSSCCCLRVTMYHGPAQEAIEYFSSIGKLLHEPLARYVKLRVVHALGMPRTFSLPLWVSNPNMHHGTCVMHVPCCMLGSLTSGFLWSQWQGKRSRHSRRMRNHNFTYLVRGPYPDNQGPVSI